MYKSDYNSAGVDTVTAIVKDPLGKTWPWWQVTVCWIVTSKDTTVTHVLSDEIEIPTRFALHQNFPNPFNAETIIKYEVPNATHVTIKIFNMFGQEITTLVDAQRPIGVYQVAWNGKNNLGKAVASGIYAYQIVTKEFVRTRKLLLLR